MSGKNNRGTKKIGKEFDPEAYVKQGVTIEDVKEVKEVGYDDQGF